MTTDQAVSAIKETPVVSEFLRYDELPVSEYTGIPNISIPLYEIKEKDFSFPIALTYHAGGLKVNQEATWVGLGWDLLSNVSVVQIVKDEDDIRLFPSKGAFNLYPDWRSNGGHQYGGFLFLDCWNKTVNGGNINAQQDVYEPSLNFGFYYSTRGYIPVGGRYHHWEDRVSPTSEYDSEPDIFKINIPGETLSCIFKPIYGNKIGSSPQLIILNKKGYMVEYIEDESVGQWKITDLSGNSYYFQTCSETYNLTMERTYKIQNRSWHLNKIETPLGSVINFNYTNAGKFTKTYKNNTRVVLFSQIADEVPENVGAYVNRPSFNNYNRDTQIEETQYYLTSITFPKGRVVFSLSNRTDIPNKKKLDKMIVYNYLNEKIREITYQYSYYSGVDVQSRKLKLNTVKINNEKPYGFQYNSTSLPSIHSYAVDYWGYYNGHESNKSLAPNPMRFKSQYSDFSDIVVTDVNVKDNNKSARLEYTKTGILEQINYPTGGWVTFDYELNTYSNSWIPNYNSSTNTISFGRGLRVKKITYFTEDNQQIKQERYTYEDGKDVLPLELFRIIVYNIKNSHNPSMGRLSVTRVSEIICSSGMGYSESPLSSFSGVGYGKVIKETLSADLSANGKIETYYNNAPSKKGPTGLTVREALQPSLPAFKDYTKPENGTPQKRVYYDKDGGKVLAEQFSYTNTDFDIYYGVSFTGYSPQIYGCHSGLTIFGRYLMGYYPIFDFESLLSKKTTTQYSKNDSIVKYENFTHNEINLVTIRTESFGMPDQTNHMYKYAFDEMGAAYGQMRGRNIYDPLIETQIVNYNYSRILELRRTSYTNVDSITNGLILPLRQTHSYSPSSSIIISYDKYDKKGNLLQCTGRDQIPISYLWSYNYFYPVAQIKNATYAEVSTIWNSISGSSTDVLAAERNPGSVTFDRLAQLRDRLPQSEVTIYKSKPLIGVTSVIDPTGIETVYKYDNNGRLKEILQDGDVINHYQYHFRN